MRTVYNIIALVTVTTLTCALAGRAGPDETPNGTFTLTTPPDGATWTLKVDGKQTFVVARDGKLGVEGSYKLRKDEIEFTDEKGPFAEKEGQKTGTYKWKLADRRLTFTKVKDEAKGRATILTSGAWEVKKK